MRIAYLHPDDGGCTYYRADLPLDTMDLKKAANTIRIRKGDSADDIEQVLMPCDIYLSPRPADEKVLKNIEILHEYGKKMVVDFDDNLWDVSPLSPHYKDFGTENYTQEMPDGTKLPVWVDGESFSIEKNLKTLDAVKQVCAAADMVTTTTEILAGVYRQWSNNVVVLPNCVDLTIWRKLPLLRSDDYIRIYWSGGSSHYEDFFLLSEVLPVIMDKYPQVKLVVMGHLFKGTVKNIPKDRIEFHQWVPTAVYPYKTAIINADISLIPLQNTAFSRAKSSIKWVEQSALEIPSVVSYVSPYKEMMEGDNAIFVENYPDAWIEGISLLIEDPILRAKVGGEARRYVEQHYDIATQYPRWVRAYQGLLNRRRPVLKALGRSAFQSKAKENGNDFQPPSNGQTDSARERMVQSPA